MPQFINISEIDYKMQPEPTIELQPQRSSIEDALPLLQKLYTKLIEEPTQPEHLIREYISQFVEIHYHSEQYFTIFAEHDFLVLMLEQQKKLSNTCILECLNLLIKNTKNEGELVYYLSQAYFHQYLFCFTLSDKNTQFVEYYVQLLKTLLLKINETNKSLIKIFCNTKYPSFPLLLNCTLLATDQNQLVRVTGQQCVLIIVGMVNEKGVMREYLGEWMMLVLVWKLGREYVGGDDREGVVKYLVDLMFQLRDNSVALVLSNAVLANTVVISLLPDKYTLALAFLTQFAQGIILRISQTQLHRTISDRLQIILLVHFRLLIKYLTNKYIRGVYLTTHITLTTISFDKNKQENVLIEKILHQYACKEYLEDESKVEIENKLHHGLTQKIEEYEKSRELEKLKQNYLKKNQKDHENILMSIYKKFRPDSSVSQFLKYIVPFLGVSPLKGESISRELNKCYHTSTSAFVAEFRDMLTKLKKGVKAYNLCQGQHSEDCEPYQIHFNDIRDAWGFTSTSLYYFATLSKQLHQFIHTNESQILISKLQIPYYFPFLNQVKYYLCASIHHHFNRNKKNEELITSVRNIKMLGKLVGGLKVKVKEEVIAGLVEELIKVHQHIQNHVFQLGWKRVVRYVLEEYEKKKSFQVLEQPKQKAGKQDHITVRKFAIFEAIQKIIDPNLSSVYHILSKNWTKCLVDTTLPTYQLQAANSGITCIATLQPVNYPPSVLLKLTSPSRKVILSLNISEIEDIRCNKIDGRVVQIIGCQQTMKMRTYEEALLIIKVVKDWKDRLEECTIGACLDYLERVFDTIIRGVKGNVVKLGKMQNMETPC